MNQISANVCCKILFNSSVHYKHSLSDNIKRLLKLDIKETTKNSLQRTCEKIPSDSCLYWIIYICILFREWIEHVYTLLIYFLQALASCHSYYHTPPPKKKNCILCIFKHSRGSFCAFYPTLQCYFYIAIGRKQPTSLRQHLLHGTQIEDMS